mmetsp:Transcript_30011/g.30463  ORF Transcript_30011/g.30463 Transcript_30011/m.30463 type:complete len:126 (+) Transcript_30011:454-831(+)
MSVAARAMSSVNAAMTPQDMSAAVHTFQKVSEQMEVSAESWNELMEEFDGDGRETETETETERETDLVMNQVLDELGVSVGVAMTALPVCSSQSSSISIPPSEGVQSVSNNGLSVSSSSSTTLPS